MKKDKHKTAVKFLLDDDGTVFALFPYVVADRNKALTCYAHVGQHSACSAEYADACKEALPEQYHDLQVELEGLGYNLQVLNARIDITKDGTAGERELPEWKDVRIDPVRLKSGGIEVCKPAKAEFFGVYVVTLEGFAHWVADLPTMELATRLKNLLLNSAAKKNHHNFAETLAYISADVFNQQKPISHKEEKKLRAAMLKANQNAIRFVNNKEYSDKFSNEAESINKKLIANVSMYERFRKLFDDNRHGHIELINEVIAWAKEFEKIYEGREWDGEWYETLDAFIEVKLNNK